MSCCFKKKKRVENNIKINQVAHQGSTQAETENNTQRVQKNQRKNQENGQTEYAQTEATKRDNDNNNTNRHEEPQRSKKEDLKNQEVVIEIENPEAAAPQSKDVDIQNKVQVEAQNQENAVDESVVQDDEGDELNGGKKQNEIQEMEIKSLTQQQDQNNQNNNSSDKQEIEKIKQKLFENSDKYLEYVKKTPRKTMKEAKLYLSDESTLLGEAGSKEVEILYRVFLYLHLFVEYDHDSLTGPRKQQDPDSVFSSGLAVCDGFAQLFNDLVDTVNFDLELKKISGHAKGAGYVPGEKTTSNHAWSGIIYNGVKYLCDPCWGAGHSKAGGSKTWVQELNNHYFLCNPEYFIYDHFPEGQPEWQLLEQPWSLEKYDKMPYFYSTYFKNSLKLMEYQDTNTIICEDGKGTIQIEFPEGQGTEFSVSLKDYKSKEKKEGLGIVQLINEKTAETSFSFKESGEYLLIIFSKLTEENKSSYSSTIEFKIVCKKANDKFQEYPTIFANSYGSSIQLLDFQTVLEEGKGKISLKTTENFEYLINISQGETKIEGCSFVKNNKELTDVLFNLKQAGKYKLNIFAKKPEGPVSAKYAGLYQFTIDCKKGDDSFSGYPYFYDAYKKQELNLDDYELGLGKGKIVVSCPEDKKTDFMVELKTKKEKKKIEGGSLVQKQGNKAVIVFGAKEKGEYELTIFSKQGEGGGSYQGAIQFQVKYDANDDKFTGYPTVYDCEVVPFLCEPMCKYLEAGTHKFRITCEEEREFVVINNGNFNEMKQDENDKTVYSGEFEVDGKNPVKLSVKNQQGSYSSIFLFSK